MRGFTLIEILVVIGMIAVLASIVLVAVNPLRQFAQARNAQRESDVNAILNAVGERLADNKGVFQDTSRCANDLPNTDTAIKRSAADLRPCLIPAYISELPMDPSTGTNTCSDIGCAGAGEDYDTGYTISEDPDTSRITVCAPGAAESAIADSAPYCVTR
ncbi:MAG TPA: type II secretion system protein [Candidatus Paceibacterota bacterium]|nr:type II secretion system protein [Candidatus Paceibacterota bacterium]